MKPSFISRLSTKITMIALASGLLLAAAISVTVVLGFEKARNKAELRAEQGLEEQEREVLLSLTQSEADVTALQLQPAIDITQAAATYLAQAFSGSISYSSRDSTWDQGPDGLLWDSEPNRKSELVAVPDLATDESGLREAERSVILESLFPVLFDRFPGASAIYYLSTHGFVRYYPVVGLSEKLTDLESLKNDPSLRLSEPAANPNRDTIWLSAYQDPFGQGWMITASSPVYQDERFLGVVNIDISLQSFVNHMNTIRTEPNGYAFLVDNQGSIVAAPDIAFKELFPAQGSSTSPQLDGPLQRDLYKNPDPILRQIVDDMRKGYSGITSLILGGKEVYLAYAPVSNIHWSLAVVAPLSEITSQASSVSASIRNDAQTTFRSTFLTILLISLVVLLGSTFLGQHVLSRPIRELVKGVRLITNGDLEVDLPVKSRDELGILASSFNLMASKLSQRTQDLTQTNLALREEIAERKRTEQALLESKDTLRTVVTNAPITLWGMDPNGIVTLSEGKGLANIGLRPGQVVGQSIFDLNAGRPDIQEVMRQALSGKEMVSILEDTDEVFETRYMPHFTNSGELLGVTAVSVIITERKQAENALQQQSQILRSILDNMGESVVVADNEGKFLLFNPAAEKLLGLGAIQAPPSQWSEKYHIYLPESKELCPTDQLPLVRAIQGENVDNKELVIYTGDGKEEKWINCTARPILDETGAIRGGVIVFRDITQRKLAEAALRLSEEQYHSIFASATDGLFINDLSGRMVDFNPAACRMHGYSDAEFRMLQPADFIHPDSLDVFNEYIQTVRAGDQFRGRALDVRKDGSTFHVEVFGTGFAYGGQPHSLAVVRDISEEVQAYQLLEQRVKERTSELSALLEVSRNVASTLEVEPLLHLILNQLKTVVDYTGAIISRFEGEELVILDYYGPISREKMIRRQMPKFMLADYQEKLLQGEPVIVGDMWSLPTFTRIRESPDGEFAQQLLGHVNSWMAVPLNVKDHVIGLLRVEHEKRDYYSNRDARLVVAFASQAAVALENAHLYEQAQFLAALQERQKLARELHDSVSQALYGIALGARTARRLLDSEPQRAVQPMDYVISLVETGLAEMRALIFELRPESLEKEGLISALTKLVESFRARHTIEVKTNFCDEPDIALWMKESLYRITQEAFNNIIRHSQASQVSLALCIVENNLLLEITDDGVGFDASKDYPGHLGLRSMRERAENVGGSLEIESQPGKGTTICVSIPIR